ncbi:MAG: HAD hydrolase-like protein [Microgenomates group bacterium]
MKKTILLFDIDYTIFDTDIYKRMIAEKFTLKYQLDATRVALFDEQYEKNLGNVIGINIKEYSRLFGEQFDISPDILFTIVMDTKEFYTQSLYPDALVTLTLLSKEYPLGIFSQGYRDFQENKLEKCGIMSYFKKEHIFIFPDKTQPSVLKTLPENAVIIEDKLSVVQKIVPPLRAIHMDRSGTQKYNPSVTSLSGLPSLLTRLL